MSTPKSAKTGTGHGINIPRSLALTIALIVWPALMVVCHGVIPRMVSRLTIRHGWAEGRPGVSNAGGLLMVLVGGAVLVWTLVTHVEKIPERVRIEPKAPWEFTPQYLVASGPYAFTRNPMYVAILALWLGWAIFYGSAGVAAGCLVLAIAINVVARREERALEARFGDAYRRYKATVPRWIGTKRARNGAPA